MSRKAKSKRKDPISLIHDVILDLGLDHFVVSVIDGNSFDKAGSIHHHSKEIFLAPQAPLDLADTLIHEIVHYLDKNLVNDALQRADTGSDSEYHPSVNRFAKGLVTVLVRNWPFWESVFKAAYAQHNEETRSD